MVRVLTLFLAVTLSGIPSLSAGEYNEKLSPGDLAPAFTALPGVDDKTLSLADLKDRSVVVLAITCNHCPVAMVYENRLIELVKKYRRAELAVVAINVNLDEADALPKMKERAREQGYNYPYLIDESQQIARALGATTTPEFFVFDAKRWLVYQGSFDDDLKRPKINYVDAAVRAALDGVKPVKQETRPRGCDILYKK